MIFRLLSLPSQSSLASLHLYVSAPNPLSLLVMFRFVCITDFILYSLSPRVLCCWSSRWYWISLIAVPNPSPKLLTSFPETCFEVWTAGWIAPTLLWRICFSICCPQPSNVRIQLKYFESSFLFLLFAFPPVFLKFFSDGIILYGSASFVDASLRVV